MYYHTHTYRCGHASGTDEEYIKRAIDCGFPELGFADHAPFRFPNGRETGNRIPTHLAEEYINSLRELKEKYKKRIKIHIGFEMEYYPLYFDEMLLYVKMLGAEYLILGQHFIKNEIPELIDANDEGHTAEQLSDYADNIIGGIKTGKFSYVAHPDFFRFNDKDVYKKELEKICITAKEHDIPLEINLSGIHKKAHHPSSTFLSVAAENGNTMIFGMDAHTPERVFDEEALTIGKELAKKYNLNVIDKLEIKGL